MRKMERKSVKPEGSIQTMSKQSKADQESMIGFDDNLQTAGSKPGRKSGKKLEAEQAMKIAEINKSLGVDNENDGMEAPSQT